MTCIAALVLPDRAGVVMAADSASTFDGQLVSDDTPKILRKKVGRTGGELLIGIAGRHSLAQIIAHDLTISDSPDPDDEADCNAWAFRIAVAVTDLAVDARPPLTTHDGSVDGRGLLAHGGRLWVIGELIAMPVRAYAAIGSGGNYALGALHVLDDRGLLLTNPTRALGEAVAAAIRYDTGCSGHIVMEALVHEAA
ncbi:MAG: hypothetical protein ACJ74O_13580 [Frankiaceae bacterium]